MRITRDPLIERRRAASVRLAWLLLPLVLAALVPLQPALAQTSAPPTVCQGFDGSRTAFLDRLRRTSGSVLSVQPVETAGEAQIATLNLLPAENNVRLVLRPNNKNGWTNADQVVAVAIPKDAATDQVRGLRVIGANEMADGTVHVRVRLSDPPGGQFWRVHDVLAFGCADEAAMPAFVARTRIAVSSLWPAAGAAILAVGLFYLIAAATAKRRLGAFSWDPVQITAGADGRGSISKLQILFFTLIVAGMLVYVLLRVGRLGDLSADVLLLLGISGVGGAAVKQASVLRRRLSAENWAWLRRRGWEPPEVQAGWADLVMEGSEFDIYRFQILIFSVVVGGALLFTGLFGLANFELPAALMGLLGLSQVVYLSGKVVSKPETVELNKAITSLRKQAAAAARKGHEAASGGAEYDYKGVPEVQEMRSTAADVERLTETVFGGTVPNLRKQQPHELM